MKINKLITTAVAAVVLSWGMSSMARGNGRGNGERGKGRGEQVERGKHGQRGGKHRERMKRGGKMDPEKMWGFMSKRMQERMNIKDEEWQVIEPLLKDVQLTQMKNRMGAMRGMFGRGRGGKEEAKGAVAELTKALKDKADAATIKVKLAAVRKEKEDKAADLKAKKDKLRQVLTVQQEAQLVLIGILD